MSKKTDGADYVRIEIRRGAETRTIELKASGSNKILVDLQVEQRLTAPYGMPTTTREEPAGTAVHLTADAPTWEGLTVRKPAKKGRKR
ncbi:hypothetical protein [Actinoplanes sp. URMC 104]|uniref:hypothetical protein n=1 Tax=Actinoplanes sp. URMC 104 TaxID=3423409 RepID=UPI003F1B241D